MSMLWVIRNQHFERVDEKALHPLDLIPIIPANDQTEEWFETTEGAMKYTWELVPASHWEKLKREGKAKL